MLLQSQTGGIELLPALPSAWPNGSVRGLCARGGLVVDIAWRRGKLVSATIFSRHGVNTPVRYGEGFTSLELQPGQKQGLQPESFHNAIPLKPGNH